MARDQGNAVTLTSSCDLTDSQRGVMYVRQERERHIEAAPIGAGLVLQRSREKTIHGPGDEDVDSRTEKAAQVPGSFALRAGWSADDLVVSGW